MNGRAEKYAQMAPTQPLAKPILKFAIDLINKGIATLRLPNLFLANKNHSLSFQSSFFKDYIFIKRFLIPIVI